MQIPFVDALLGRGEPDPADPPPLTGAAGGPLDDPTAVVDTIDETARTDEVLLLQKMENRLVRHTLAHPDVLGADTLRRLRYLLNFARLTDFEPGAAGPGATRGRGDVAVGAELAGWRSRVADLLRGPLRDETDPVLALTAARDALERLAECQDEQRAVLIDHHRNDFSPTELDAEVGYKKLVSVLGGGGGAGFVYIGAMQRLLAAGHTPDYLMGSSFGAIIAAVVGRSLPVPIEEYVQWAKTVSFRGILGPERLQRRHGLTGMFTLRFDEFAASMFSCDDGTPMRMADLQVPFDAVVAGVRNQSFAALPSRFRRQQLAALQLRLLPFLPIGIGPQVGARMWQVAAFIDSRVTKPIVLGADDLTRGVNVVDAVSFSSAVPGVLHHETSDPAMVGLFDELCAEHDVAALADGGAASNVPVELAWKQVRDGRLGSRNACYLAFDCFHPQWDPKNLWLVPITQAIQLQMVRNLPYADHLIRFSPTLSPANLAPSTAAIDRACQWGADSLESAVPVIDALRTPVWWHGDHPVAGEPERTEATGSVAASMGSVFAAMREPGGRLQRWRDRRLT